MPYSIAVAEYGNITRAADKLYISKPALSQTMKRIEQEMGVQLFQRFIAIFRILGKKGREDK